MSGRDDGGLVALAEQYMKEWDSRDERSTRLAIESGGSATSQVDDLVDSRHPDSLRLIEALVAAAAARGEAGLAYVAAGPVEDYIHSSRDARARLEAAARHSKVLRFAIDLAW